MSSIINACIRLFNDCIGARKKDAIVILYDHRAHEIARALADAAYMCGNPVAPLLLCNDTMRIGRDSQLPEMYKSIIAKAQVLITCLPDGDSFANFRAAAIAAAMSRQAKCIHLPGVDYDLFSEAVENTDYESVRNLSAEYAERLTSASHVSIVTRMRRKELRLSFDLADRPVHQCNGTAQPGHVINLPTGEAYVAPLEGTANGSIALRGSTGHRTYREADGVVLQFEDGVMIPDKCQFASNDRASFLREYIESLEHESRMLCEFGIGTNSGYRKLTGSEVRDEKVAGTIHIAIGTNLIFGGTVDADIHRDIIIRAAELAIDGKPVELPGDLS